MLITKLSGLIASLLPAATVLGMAVVVILIVLIFIPAANKFVKIIARHSLWLSFGVAASALLLSLFYSDVAGYAPCALCWYQRILIYPQAVILGMAAWRNDLNVRIYCLTLSIIGAVIATYHYLLQFGVASPALAPCALHGGVSCADRLFTVFGFVTIPFMSLTAFLLIIAFLSVSFVADRRNK